MNFKDEKMFNLWIDLEIIENEVRAKDPNLISYDKAEQTGMKFWFEFSKG